MFSCEPHRNILNFTLVRKLHNVCRQIFYDELHDLVQSIVFNLLTPELNPSAQRCLTSFLLGILIFKGLTVRRLYK
jgi:hypothetical protein